ncbi:MAG TPA: hypothetical protein VK508_10015 [Cyclobacteriaceae bacterium]|nr:hypothetical protein [Cyclobacteriaceae bacterium]
MMLHKAHASLLIAALIFGQIGAGFLHTKHDAHEALIDFDQDQTVLLNHGEHCKVCAVDWLQQSDLIFFEFVPAKTVYHFSFPIEISSLTDLALISHNNKAPPFLS